MFLKITREFSHKWHISQIWIFSSQRTVIYVLVLSLFENNPKSICDWTKIWLPNVINHYAPIYLDVYHAWFYSKSEERKTSEKLKMEI